jgi:hypothetical protein
VKGINEISPVFPTFSPSLDKFVQYISIKMYTFIMGFVKSGGAVKNHALPCFPHQWEVYIDFLDDFVEWKAVKVCCYTSC